MTRKQKRLSVIAGAMLFLGIATGLAVFALGQKASYFYMPADLAGTSLPPGQRIRLGGLVEKGTIERGVGTEVRFDVTDAQQAIANEERLARVLLTAQRLQHFLGNQLALTLGYVELLTLDPRLPSELRERVDEALRGVIEASETLSQLRLVTRLELHQDDPGLGERLGHTDSL